jgi:peptidylprolyl isomerase
MQKFPHFFKKFILVTGIIFFGGIMSAEAMDKDNILFLDLDSGRVVIEMKPDIAPKHVERIKKLTREGFYDGIIFHRVIDGFMAQTGDPTGTGTGGSDLPDLNAEFNNYNFGRGAIGMARTNDPNSANSQFFICFDDCSFLNGQYTVWGQVIDGMQYVDQITRGEPPRNPDAIVKMQVAADAAQAAE